MISLMQMCVYKLFQIASCTSFSKTEPLNQGNYKRKEMNTTYSLDFLQEISKPIYLPKSSISGSISRQKCEKNGGFEAKIGESRFRNAFPGILVAKPRFSYFYSESLENTLKTHNQNNPTPLKNPTTQIVGISLDAQKSKSPIEGTLNKKPQP